MVVLLLTVKASIYEQNLYEKLQKYGLFIKTLKIGGFVVDRKNIDL